MVQFDRKTKEKRLEEVTDSYVSGDINEEELNELLDSILDGGPPYLDDFILKSYSTKRQEDGSVLFFGEKLRRDGNMFRKVDDNTNE